MKLPRKNAGHRLGHHELYPCAVLGGAPILEYAACVFLVRRLDLKFTHNIHIQKPKEKGSFAIIDAKNISAKVLVRHGHFLFPEKTLYIQILNRV